MQGYNCIAVIHKNKTDWLMCRRLKDPYKGKLNLVGGKIEQGEDHLEARRADGTSARPRDTCRKLALAKPEACRSAEMEHRRMG